MKRVLVIVVTYNGRHWLERCLGSVSGDGRSEPAMTGAGKAEDVMPGQTGLPLVVDLYVFDNDSTDGSAEFVAARFPQAKLVRSAENSGFSQPNNLGMQWAMDHGYDFVYLLNQDAWLEAGALEKLVAAACAHPDYAVLSPLQMIDGYQSLDAQFAKCYHPCAKTAQNEYAPLAVPRIMAAHWLVPVAAIRKIGLFEEELFPLYGQDDDWCKRAQYHGLKVGVVPAARAVHDRAQRKESLERVIDRNYRVGSLLRLCDITRPLWERFLFVCLFTVVKAVKYGNILPFKHFRSLCKMLPQVRKARKAAKQGA